MFQKVLSAIDPLFWIFGNKVSCFTKKNENVNLSFFILLQREGEGKKNKIWAILYPNIRDRQDRGNGVNFTKTETV